MDKHQKSKKLALDSSLQTYQILTNDDEMLILCLSYFSTTVIKIGQVNSFHQLYWPHFYLQILI